MLLCLNIGARNALDTLQICNGVDITWSNPTNNSTSPQGIFEGRKRYTSVHLRIKGHSLII